MPKWNCPECKDTKEYQPLVGPPEPCRACCGEPAKSENDQGSYVPTRDMVDGMAGAIFQGLSDNRVIKISEDGGLLQSWTLGERGEGESHGPMHGDNGEYSLELTKEECDKDSLTLTEGEFCAYKQKTAIKVMELASKYLPSLMGKNVSITISQDLGGHITVILEADDIRTTFTVNPRTILGMRYPDSHLACFFHEFVRQVSDSKHKGVDQCGLEQASKT